MNKIDVKSFDKMLADHYSEFAEAARIEWGKTLDIINMAIRANDLNSVKGSALVTVLSYPESLKRLGYEYRAVRDADKCKYAYSVLEQLYNRSFVVLSRIASDRGLDVAAVEAGKLALLDAFSMKRNGDGLRYGLTLPENTTWPEHLNGDDWETLPTVTRQRLEKLQSVLDQINHAPVYQEAKAGWKLNKLQLVTIPSNGKPAVFKYGEREYSAPGGAAWKIISQMIIKNAVDGHGIKIISPNRYFKGINRPFFTDRLGKNDSGWFIKTL